jgi:hypothetical protein
LFVRNAGPEKTKDPGREKPDAAVTYLLLSICKIVAREIWLANKRVIRIDETGGESKV